jgi:hypothetical protein
MKLKFGAIVTDGRNKVGGHVLSKNRAGSYMRTKVTPVNRQSSAQTTVRARLASLSTGFRGLGATLVAAWNNAVAQFKTTDIFGDIHNPTGLTLYQRLNNNLAKIGVTAITTPPLPIAVSIFSGTPATLVASLAGQSLTLTYAPAIPSSPLEKVYISATPSISPGRSFVKSDFRYIQTIAAADTSPVVLSVAYLARFGAIGAIGQKIFVKCQHISATTGQASIPQIIQCVVTT